MTPNTAGLPDTPARGAVQRWLERPSTLIATALLAAVTQLSVLSVLAGDVDLWALIRLQTTFTEAGFSAIYDGWSDAARGAFRAHFAVDFVHPFAYGVAIASAAAFLLRRHGLHRGRWRGLILLAPAAALCDLVENTCHLVLTSDPQAMSPGVLVLSGSAGTVKWVLFSAAVLTVSALAVGALRARLATRP